MSADANTTPSTTCGSSGVACAAGETCCGNTKCVKLKEGQKCCPEGCDKCDLGDACDVGCGLNRQCGNNSCCDADVWCGGNNAHCNLDSRHPICASDKTGAQCVGGIPCAASQTCANGYECDESGYCKCNGEVCPSKDAVCVPSTAGDDSTKECCVPERCPQNTCGFNGCTMCKCLPGYTCVGRGKCVNLKLVGYLTALGIVFAAVTAGGIYLLVRMGRMRAPPSSP